MNYPKVSKAIIAAAGLGTRFLPQTKAMPKEMLPIIDKPVIQLIVEEAVSAGVTDIIIVTGSTKRAIEDHFDRAVELEDELKNKGKLELAEQIKQIAEIAYREGFFEHQRNTPVVAKIIGTGETISILPDDERPLPEGERWATDEEMESFDFIKELEQQKKETSQ